MAGNFPDPPGNRLAWDRDGTQVFIRWGSTGFDQLGGALSAAQHRTLNNESTDSLTLGGASDHFAAVVLFPSQRDLTHLHLSFEPSYDFGWTIQWSANTTTGVDGTWTNVTGVTNKGNSRVGMRTALDAVSLFGVKGIRFSAFDTHTVARYPSLHSFHFYGKPSSLYSNRLLFWHPTNNSPLLSTPAHLDWGDRPRNSTQTRSVRICNMSTALTATDIVVSMEALTDANPTMVSQHELRYDGGAYGSQITIPSLGPQQISEMIDIKQALLITSSLSLWTQRLVASPGSWV